MSALISQKFWPSITVSFAVRQIAKPSPSSRKRRWSESRCRSLMDGVPWAVCWGRRDVERADLLYNAANEALEIRSGIWFCPDKHAADNDV